MAELQFPDHLVLSADEELRRKLRAKKKEYKNRLDGYDHPELQLLKEPDAFLKHYLIAKLIDEGQVDRKESENDLMTSYHKLDQATRIQKCLPNAWGVIADYCINGGTHTVRGDGKTGFGESKEHG